MVRISGKFVLECCVVVVWQFGDCFRKGRQFDE